MASSISSPRPVPNKLHEADTIKKNRFFHAIDNRPGNVTIKDICEHENVSHDTKKRWLNRRKRYGAVTLRRTGKARSGRFKKMSSDMMDQMLDLHQNPVRDQSWPVQIEHFNLDVSSRTLRAAFNQRRPRASRFKKVKIRTISEKNKKFRVQYGLDHQHHIVENFFQYVHFSDEAHFDLDQIYNQFILRKKDIKYESENMQSMPDMKDVKLHVAAFISWHHKGAFACNFTAINMIFMYVIHKCVAILQR